MFAESIDADFFPLLPNKHRPSDNPIKRLIEYNRAPFSYPTDYDYLLLEGGRTLLSGAVFKLLHNDTKVILLNADETFINVVDGLDHYGPGEKYVHRLAASRLDGVMSVGEFVNDYARRAGVTVPSQIVHPNIESPLFENLGEVSPSIGSKRIVSVGVGKPSVGFDILVEAFADVRADHPDAELHIAGEGHSEQWNEVPGVTVHGWVDDLAEFFASGELSVHPGRSECFPVSTLEPLRAGIPSVVSEMVGTKSVMESIHPNLVTKLSPEATADAISWYFDLSRETREELSQSARTKATTFSEEECSKRFKQRYETLTAQISS